MKCNTFVFLSKGVLHLDSKTLNKFVNEMDESDTNLLSQRMVVDYLKALEFQLDGMISAIENKAIYPTKENLVFLLQEVRHIKTILKEKV